MTEAGLRGWARRIKRDVTALWLAARDRRVSLLPKAVAGLVVAYALSPIDLIPDFIPVLGLLDDAILVPLGIMLAVRLVPPSLMADFRERAQEMGRQPRSMAGVAIVGLVWLAAVAWLALLFWPLR